MLIISHISRGGLFFFVFMLAFNLSINNSKAQVPYQTPYYVISEVAIEGNKRTKPIIILREMDIEVGDSIWVVEMDSVLLRNRNRIFNTDLFTIVDIIKQIDSLTNTIAVRVEVQERWYIFPLPIFELSDRNVNEWVYQHGADLRRTNYGLRLIKKNIAGLNQSLEILIQQGFLKRYGLVYTIPYLDYKQRWGLSLGFSYAQSKSVAYQTLNHRLVFAESDKIVREKTFIKAEVQYRPKFYAFHNLTLRYDFNKVGDTVLRINPTYFLDNDTEQRFHTISYTYRYDLRDVLAYPLEGYWFRLGIEKRGILDTDQLDILHFTGLWGYYDKLAKRLYYDVTIEARWSIMDRQPYANAQGLGYDDTFLRGYELYVIDGQSYCLSKNTLKYKWIDTRKTLRFIPLKQFRTMPIAVYITGFLDLSYVDDRFFTDVSSRFSNQWIYGSGIGLDFVTYYNSLFSIDCSTNVSGEIGVFFNYSGKF
ncbi:MAG: hypothetical protein EAZ55_04955 [Cytophagales bacterium]|nr:MAG: hypothetical protein EAZ55_04955 [Cytophagales bacterium]